MENKPRLALILGSGFSSEAGLPTTSNISKQFLEAPPNGVLEPELEEQITKIIKEFWQGVFGFTFNNHPSLEDHFTVLDLAANSGHHLGPKYPPKKLRAIRRISIHRIFQLLNLKHSRSPTIEKLFAELHKCFNVSVVTLNWDIVVEKYVSNGVDYGIKIWPVNSGAINSNSKGIPLLKVHGSSNWVYCDCCRRIYADSSEKAALHKKVFLHKEDFKLFDVDVPEEILQKNLNDNCSHCGNRLGGRLATFSYRKALSINQFQTIWDCAHEVLGDSNTWLFVGYSMPEADFEFRHLLKSAQLARKKLFEWSCEVVLKDDVVAERRYRSFFGINPNQICQKGLTDWVNERLNLFCREKGRK